MELATELNYSLQKVGVRPKVYWGDKDGTFYAESIVTIHHKHPNATFKEICLNPRKKRDYLEYIGSFQIYTASNKKNGKAHVYRQVIQISGSYHPNGYLRVPLSFGNTALSISAHTAILLSRIIKNSSLDNHNFDFSFLPSFF